MQKCSGGGGVERVSPPLPPPHILISRKEKLKVLDVFLGVFRSHYPKKAYTLNFKDTAVVVFNLL